MLLAMYMTRPIDMSMGLVRVTGDSIYPFVSIHLLGTILLETAAIQKYLCLLHFSIPVDPRFSA